MLVMMIEQKTQFRTQGTERRMPDRKGVALLVVLIVVMAITILSLGFLSSSDVELACGQNMVLRTQVDYLAESGLEHARGLILNPQDISSEYWTGETSQQLIAGSDDYYDLEVVRDDTDPTDKCNYTIDCNSYRLKAGERIGRSSLRAQLRLDPCVAVWTGDNMAISSGATVNGDVYCAGNLSNSGNVDGDVFAEGTISGLDPEGKKNSSVDEPPVTWPVVELSDLIWGPYYIGTDGYWAELVSSYTHPSGSFGPSGGNPAGVRYRGSLLLPGGVDIEGTVVTGTMRISGSNNIITATKNFPALVVGGDLTINPSSELDIEGLTVVEGNVLLSADDARLNVVGGLFAQQKVAEFCNNSSCILYNGPTWQPSGGQINGALSFDGQDDVMQDTTADSYLNGLSAITISLWVKSDVTYQDRDIMFTRDPTGADEELGIRYDRDGAYGGGVRGIKASIKTTSGYAQIESSSNVQTTSWQHLALVWENDPNDSQLKLYINGVLDTLRYDSGPTTGVITGVQKLMIGCGTKNSYWDGLIDDVRIYGRALDASEISTVKAGGNISGLIERWRFDETGSTLTVTAALTKTAIAVWSSDGSVEKWGQAAGAFFRSIERR